MARLQKEYQETIQSELQKQLGYKNIMEVPKLERIVLNMGVGEGVTTKKAVQDAVTDLSAIAGQQAVQTLAKKSIAGFKLREGVAVGAKVTLRGRRMYEFLDRFVNIALPRVRDFRGLSGKSFDGRGNYSCGLKEQIVFPEIDYDKVDKIRGLDIVFVTTAKTNDEAKALLKAFHMPIQG